MMRWRCLLATACWFYISEFDIDLADDTRLADAAPRTPRTVACKRRNGRMTRDTLRWAALGWLPIVANVLNGYRTESRPLAEAALVVPQ